jgi:hypothetical protein
MDPDNLTAKNFLDELYRLTHGDMAAQVSMYDVGSTLGLNKVESGSVAETLIVEGLVELKTLAGGIAITSDGLANLGIAAPADTAADTTLAFSNGPVINDRDRLMIEKIIRQIKEGITGQPVAYDSLEEIVIDLKTIELHLLSPRPKVSVLRALLRSVHEALVSAGIANSAAELKALIT